MVNTFKDKKILVMGLGLHGGAVSVVKWLLKKDVKLTITDLKTKKELKKSLDMINKIKGSKNIQYTLGKHKLKDFENQDLIIQNPGVPRDSKYILRARDNNIPIINEALMFFRLYPSKVIGITGTRGKSTTSTLTHKILKSKIKNNVLAGNIATTPMFTVLDKLKKNSLPVLELSSWHLESLEEYSISPHIAVITNILPDHLNRYNSFNEYKKAKIAIIKNQKKDDVAILNYDNIHTKKLNKKTKAKVYYFSLKKKVKGSYILNNSIYFNNTKVMPLNNIKVLGEHNLYNILSAITIAKVVGVSNKNIEKAVNNFKGIDYRLQYIGKIKGLSVYNDATSTTPDATIAAINAMKKDNIILIAGGEDKLLKYNNLAKIIKQKVGFLLLLSGSASDELIKELKKVRFEDYKMISDIKKLKTAWKSALKHASNDNCCILFSPSAASFNMFLNEFERAKEFNKLFNETKKKEKSC